VARNDPLHKSRFGAVGSSESVLRTGPPCARIVATMSPTRAGSLVSRASIAIALSRTGGSNSAR
jgi:hypothetical protein